MEASRPAGEHDIARIVELAHVMRAELSVMKGGAIWLQREAWPDPLDARIPRAASNGTTRSSSSAPSTTSCSASGRQWSNGCGPATSLGVITDLFVEEGAREVGIGEEIMDDLVAFCTERGCIGIDGFALPGHRATKNFFEENHFTARMLTMHHRLAPAR